MADENKVTQAEFDAAIKLIRASREAVEGADVEGHSVEEAGELGFTDLNLC